jgi:hypothetical protein
VLDGLVRGRHRRTTITHDRATDLRGVGLLKISDGYLGPVLYAHKGGPKKPPKLVFNGPRSEPKKNNGNLILCPYT